MNSEKLKEIAKPYGLWISRVKPCASLYRNNAAYRLTTDQGDWVLKPFQVRGTGTGLSAVRQIRRVGACVRRIAELGYPHLSKWRTTASGQLWVNSNGKPYYVAEWVEGRPISASASDFAALGKALASLHALEWSSGKGKRNDWTRKHIRQFRMVDRLFGSHLAKLRLQRTSGRLWFARNGRESQALASRAWETLSLPAVRQILSAEKPRVIHGDVTVPNIIFAQEGIKLIDWDFARSGSAYFELAKTMSNTADFDVARMEALLQGYEEIRPLQPAERQLVAALFRLPREVWMAAKNMALGKKNAIFPIVRRTWEKRLAAVKWMDEWAEKGKNGS